MFNFAQLQTDQLTAHKVNVLLVVTINLSTRFCNCFSNVFLFLYGLDKSTSGMEKVNREQLFIHFCNARINKRHIKLLASMLQKNTRSGEITTVVHIVTRWHLKFTQILSWQSVTAISTWTQNTQNEDKMGQVFKLHINISIYCQHNSQQNFKNNKLHK